MFSANTISKFQQINTPFYFYDMDLLRRTIFAANDAAKPGNFHIHFAMKANFEERILKELLANGFGADCVSGGEVARALAVGFSPESIVFAGVGKSDTEIKSALAADIFCFNCESPQEISVIDELAKSAGKIARIALRINPDVDPHTHHYITTGKEENKFGIYRSDIPAILAQLPECKNVQLVGIHFHIGSQVTDLSTYELLCDRVNEIQDGLDEANIRIEHVNLGGGLGIDYYHPDEHPIVDFERYFGIFQKKLAVRPHQSVHFELGRALVGQCGSLISRVLYIKEGRKKQFAIIDAGMTELIRPALYQAFHKIENITSDRAEKEYDVVGPICESSDSFGKDISLPETRRGDLIAIRSAGAYGAVMASRYNLREPVQAVFSDDLAG